MLREQLLELNFTPNQANVYETLLELGQTKVGPIISKTQFHRNIVYRALEDLMARKLVYKITKRGIAYFEATDPAPLLDEIRKKQELASSVIKEIKSKKGSSKTEVLVLSGHQGVIDLCEMVIRAGEDLYLIGANYRIMETHKEYYPKYEQKLLQKHIKRFVLAQSQFRGLEELNKQAETKNLPTTFSSSPIVTWIFGETVAHLLWEQSETIFVIKNKKIADNYRQYFQILWSQNSWVLKGKEGFLELLNIISAEKQNLYYLNATGGGLTAFPEEYKKWMKEFSDQGHESYWLTMPDFDADISDVGTNHKRRKLKTKISSPTVYWIFGEYVANVLWEADMPTVFLLRNKSVAQSYRDYFNYLWEHGSVEFSQKK